MATPSVAPRFPSEVRLAGIDWSPLTGLMDSLSSPLATVLAGEAAERVVEKFLRANRTLTDAERRVAAEAIFGVGLWRIRLRAELGRQIESPRELVTALLRDVACLPQETLGKILGPAAANPSDVPQGRLPIRDRFSLPSWLADIVEAEMGFEAADLADALNVPGPITLRANLTRTTREELQERLAEEGIVTTHGRFAPECLIVEGRTPNLYGSEAWKEGLFEIQDEGSQLISHLATAPRDSRILDYCAGAGGKSLHLAALHPTSTIHCTDIDSARLERLRQRAIRARANNIRVLTEPPKPGQLYELVLVDAPCSELGALRRGPDRRFLITHHAVKNFPEQQTDILANAATFVAPGGSLVYATCTFNRAENEDVVEKFERTTPGFQSVQPLAPKALVRPDMCFQTWPHRHGTDGFFAAVFQRALV